MERKEEFQAGDRNSGNGNSLEQKEASAAVFEDGQVRDTTGEIRHLKDEESYAYGDSRPDETTPSDTFTDIGDSPMVTTTREDLPEVHKASAEELAATSHGQDDEIRPVYNRVDGTEGQEVVRKEGAR